MVNKSININETYNDISSQINEHKHRSQHIQRAIIASMNISLIHYITYTEYSAPCGYVEDQVVEHVVSACVNTGHLSLIN